MQCTSSRQTQRGVITLFLSLLMLVLITLLVTTAFSMSTTGLRAVGNMQFREEALAAAQAVIETELGGPFFAAPVELLGQPVDIDEDGDTDYEVDLSRPVCVRAYQASSTSVSSVTLPGMTSASAWNTIWEFEATVEDPRSGARVAVVQGVRALLSQSEKDLNCG